MKKSSDAFEVILRATGYEDLKKTVIPEGDREYDFELTKVRKKRARGGSTKKSKKTEAATAEPAKTEKPKKKKAKVKSDYGIRDLKDPFE